MREYRTEEPLGLRTRAHGLFIGKRTFELDIQSTLRTSTFHVSFMDAMAFCAAATVRIPKYSDSKGPQKNTGTILASLKDGRGSELLHNRENGGQEGWAHENEAACPRQCCLFPRGDRRRRRSGFEARVSQSMKVPGGIGRTRRARLSRSRDGMVEETISCPKGGLRRFAE